MSVRITLSGAELGEVVVAMESQRDYYNAEIARVKQQDDEHDTLSQQQLAELVTWRDACVSALAKIHRGRPQSATRTQAIENQEL